MAVRIQTIEMPGWIAAGDPVGYVQLFAGDAGDIELSTEWISARLKIDASNLKSLALLQIAALKQASALLDAESERLSILYQASEKSQR